MAYTFSSTGPADRTQTAELVATDGRTNDLLGTSVAIAGGTILAGAPLHQAGARSGGGAVLEFAIDGQPLLTQTAELAAPRAKRQSDYGFSVALAGDTLVAGAPGVGVTTVLPRAAASTVRHRKRAAGTPWWRARPRSHLTGSWVARSAATPRSDMMRTTSLSAV